MPEKSPPPPVASTPPSRIPTFPPISLKTRTSQQRHMSQMSQMSQTMNLHRLKAVLTQQRHMSQMSQMSQTMNLRQMTIVLSQRKHMALRHFACKENRVEKRQEPLSLPLQMPVMVLNGELKATLLILSSRSRSHLGLPVTGGETPCANWLASCVPAARKVTKSRHMSQMSQTSQTRSILKMKIALSLLQLREIVINFSTVEAPYVKG